VCRDPLQRVLLHHWQGQARRQRSRLKGAAQAGRTGVSRVSCHTTPGTQQMDYTCNKTPPRATCKQLKQLQASRYLPTIQHHTLNVNAYDLIL
jgi:hypothetical protein